MQAEKFYDSFIVAKAHLDSFGHVNNAMYLMLFEQARWKIINSKGYGLEKIKETALGPTILEINIRFLKELLLGESITIESQVTFLKNRIGVMTQKMFRDEVLCCVADFRIGLFDIKARKLVKPTHDWLEAIGVESTI